MTTDVADSDGVGVAELVSDSPWPLGLFGGSDTSGRASDEDGVAEGLMLFEAVALSLFPVLGEGVALGLAETSSHPPRTATSPVASTRLHGCSMPTGLPVTMSPVFGSIALGLTRAQE